MKTRLLFLAVLFTTSALLVNAQPPRQGQGRQMVSPEIRADRMAENLSLTDAQKSKVLELFKQEEAKTNALREEMKAMRERNETVSDAQREKMASLRKAHDAELEKIIGKEKFAQWQTQRAEQMQKMKEQRGQMGDKPQGRPMERPEARAERAEKIKEQFTPEKRAERLKTELGLSDAEKDALVQLFDAEKKKMTEDRKQKMEAMKKSHDAEVEKIIGKEKMAKYKELQKSRIDKAQKNRKVKQV